MRDSNSRRPWQPSIRALCAALPLSLTLAACGGSSGGGGGNDAPPVSNDADTAVLTTVGSDFGSGQVELVDLSDETLMSGPVSNTNTISDIGVDTDGDDYYLIERSQADQISKFNLDNPNTRIWQYSVLKEGETGSANPYQLVFVNDSKAYLLRYAKDSALIVDTDATTGEDFRGTDELDLSAYKPSGDTAPRMSAGAIVNGKLFITLQRLDSGFQPSNTSCVAVFDVSTDEVIDTGQDSECGAGIPLNGSNPGDIQYQEGVGLLVQNTGSFETDGETISGIDVIDPNSYEIETRVQATSETGLINAIAIVDADTGYFLGYDSFGSLDLRRFNPATGDVAAGAIADLSEEDLRDIAVGPEGRLWIANAETGNPRIQLMNLDSEMIGTSVTTELLPTGIDFASAEN